MSRDAFSEAALKILQTAAEAVAQAAQAVKNASEAVATSAEALKASAIAISGKSTGSAPSSTAVSAPVQASSTANVDEMTEEELVAVIAAAAADVLGVNVSQVQVVDIHEDHSWRMQGRNAIHHSHRLR